MRGALVLLVGLAVLGTAAARSADQVPATIFTSPPTDLANIAGLVPMGTLSPDSGHVLPVDHMYINYPHPFTGGIYSYPVYAMGDGEVVMVLRTWRDDITSYDYELYVRHSAAVTSQLDHLHDLDIGLRTYLDSIPGAWLPLDMTEVMVLGQFGAPDPFPVSAGDQLGITRSFFFNWNVGIIDRTRHRWFAGHGPRRYPTLRDFFGLLEIDLQAPPFPGDGSTNAGCFLDYLTPTLRAAWFDQLLSVPKDCGRPDWDLPDRLRGSWFNPAVDTAAEPPLFDLEFAAFSIVPDNFRPLTHLQVAAGSGHPLAALDPLGIHPALATRLLATVDATPGARINPDPAQVGAHTGTVCYDLESSASGQFNTLLVRMTGPRDVLLRYDPTSYPTPQCAVTATDGVVWTTHYVR